MAMQLIWFCRVLVGTLFLVAPAQTRSARANFRRAVLYRRRHLAGGWGDRQEPSLQRLRCDPAELPCLGSRSSPLEAKEEGDSEW